MGDRCLDRRGVRHRRRLRTLIDAATLEREVGASRVALRRMFHVPVNFFCYPSGRLDDRVVAAVRAAGYAGATTTEYGLARPTAVFRLARVRVDRSDGIVGLAAKLRALGAAASTQGRG